MMKEDIWPSEQSKKSAYITACWGWTPETWGGINFGSEGRRDTYLKTTTDPFIMVIFVTETAPTDQPELCGKCARPGALRQANRRAPVSALQAGVGVWARSSMNKHPDLDDDEEKNVNTALSDGIRKLAMDVRELDIALTDRINPLVPRNWFLVPFAVVDEAVERIKDGRVKSYVYDPRQARLLERKAG